MKRKHNTLVTRLMAITMLLTVAIRPTMAQTAVKEMAVLANAHDAFQLTAAAPVAMRSIMVDATSSLSVSVLAASRTLVVSLVAPDGTRRTVNDPPTATFESGFFPIDTVSTKPGASYLINIINPPAGSWTLEVREPAALTAPLDVLTTTFLNNNIFLVLAGGGDTFPLGTSVRLALVAFDGTNKIPGIAIDARLFRPFDPAFTPVAVTFRDDGTGADEVAGDRMYEAFVNPIQPGTYQVQVNASGTASTGTFRRTAATELRIVARNAQIASFTDRGLDDNADGLLDRIGITPSANVTKAGTYVVSIRLRSSNGHEIQQTADKVFGVGAAQAEVTFNAADIVRDLGVNGPYSVAEVRYFEMVPGGDLVPADIRYDLGPTAAYTLSQLQHAPLSLTGVGTGAGRDTNGNGLFDFLDISVGVLADFAGTYTYSASLTDRNGRELGFLSGNLVLNVGANTLTIRYPGLPIGRGGVDGPYFLANLIMFGAGQSLIAPTAFTTPAFLVTQFEGAAVVPAADNLVTMTYKNKMIVVPAYLVPRYLAKGATLGN